MARFRTNDQEQIVTTLYQREGLSLKRVQNFNYVALMPELNPWRTWTFRIALSGTRYIGYRGQRYAFLPNTICWHSPLSEPVQLRWLPGTGSDHILVSLTGQRWNAFLSHYPTFRERHATLLQDQLLALHQVTPPVLYTLRRLLALTQLDKVPDQALENQSHLLLDLLGSMHFGVTNANGDAEQRQRVENAIALMAQDLGRPMSIAQIASALKVSERQLQRDFVAYTGLTPLRYWNLLRLNEANFLLAETSLPVAEIATTLGYVSLAHFSSAFRQMYHCSPRQVRTELYASLSDA